MIASYHSLAEPSQGEYKDKGSKLIGFAYPVKNEKECKEILERIRKEHLKSRHICYAFRIGIENQLERNSDAGEPSGTGGKPILGQIHSFGLDNVLVIVVRYFGGTLLGIPGLIAAYKGAAEAALKNGNIISKQVVAHYELKFGYEVFNELMNFLKKANVEITGKELGEYCRMMVEVEVGKRLYLEQNLTNFNNVKFTFTGYE